MIKILGLLGMYFDAVAAEVKKNVFLQVQIGSDHTVKILIATSYVLCETI